MGPLFTYGALACLISWAAMLAFAGLDGFPLTAERAATVGALALLGPSVAGLVMIAATRGRAGLRTLGKRLVTWRVPARWYAVALLLAPCVDVLAVSLLSSRVPTVRPVFVTADQPAALVAQGMVAGLVVALFEELGWTGFAVPVLRRRVGAVMTGVWVGTLWGLWHLPMFWQRGSFAAPLPLLLLAAKLFAWLPPYRIMMVWMHDRTQSLLLCVLMHAGLVTSLTFVEPAMDDGVLLWFILLRAALLWLIVAAVVVVVRRREFRTAGGLQGSRRP